MHINTNQIDIFVQLPVEPEVFNFEKYHQIFSEFFNPKIYFNAQYYLSNLEFRFTSGLTGSDNSSKISSKFFSNNFTLKFTRIFIITNQI